jgi:hypothetical protein
LGGRAIVEGFDSQLAGAPAIERAVDPEVPLDRFGE